MKPNQFFAAPNVSEPTSASHRLFIPVGQVEDKPICQYKRSCYNFGKNVSTV